MLRAIRREVASSGCATELLDPQARALLTAFGRDPASTSTSSFFSLTSTTSTTPTKISSTDLVASEPGVVRIDAYDADSFELTTAGGSGRGGERGGKGKGGGRRHRVRGPLVVSAPGGFVAKWKPEPSGSSSSAPPKNYYSRIAGSVSAIAALVSPRPDIVLVGTGGGGGGSKSSSSSSSSSSSPVAAMQRISEAAGGAAVEIYPTPQAASLYNVLSQEGRSVLAALLPAGEKRERG